MATPVWVTQAGTLGTIQENVFYEFALEGYDPNGDELEYTVISGYLPPGLIMTEQGTIQGRPKTLYLVRGIPSDVSEDITSDFVCRLTSTDGKISDRTFQLTVTGQDAPEIITNSQELARVPDGTWFEVQLEARDLDNEPITWSIIDGSLPPGVTLDKSTGLLSGYIQPTINETAEATVGWSAESGWEEYPWDHASKWLNQGYEFTVEITDGKEFDQAKYSVFVYAKSLLTADIDSITADDVSNITADNNEKHTPVMITKPADLGMYEHDNYFAYQFQGIDFDNEEINYGITTNDGFGFDSVLGSGFDTDLFDQGDLGLPPGLTFNSETGWLYGYIGRQVKAQSEYQFAVYAYKKNDQSVRSRFVYFTLTILGDLNKALVWKTNSNLGTIQTGEISELAVEASSQFDIGLTYRMIGNSRLPQGLRLLDNGLIIGRPSFETTQFDGGTTTFDDNIREKGSLLPTMRFDTVSRFTVEASSANRELIATRTFSITVEPSDYEPYESLWLQAQPGIAGKNLLLSLINNSDIIPTADLYRNGDPNFGRARDARMLLISGLRSSAATDYIQAMSQNHYRKTIPFGSVKLDKAYNSDREVIYEVLYFDVNDDQANSNGSTAASKILNNIKRPIAVDSNNITVDNSNLDVDGLGNKIIYPNSFENMRNTIKNAIGSDIREPLPKWMGQRQIDGSVIGWKPVVVIAYLKPGTGEKALFNTQRRNGFIDQQLISFEVDRYIWDNNLSSGFNTELGTYEPSTPVTFDAEVDYSNPNPVAEVDFALSVPFNHIDGRTTQYIDSLGGLDGLVLSYDKLTVIFATQEQYTGYVEPNDGWIRNDTFWDDSLGWDNSNSMGWDDYSVIPGYVESNTNPLVQNQRAGIWQFTRDENNSELWRLEFQQEISPGETVTVRNGAQYGGYLCQYGPLIEFSEGETVPRWRIAEPIQFKDATIFDGNATRFIDNINIYEQPDVNDKYLVFPKRNIWA